MLASERGYNFNEFVLKCQSPHIFMTRILVVNLRLFGLTIRTLTNMLFVLHEICTCWLWYLCRHVLMHVYVLSLLENCTFLRFLSKESIGFFFFFLGCVYVCFDVLSIPIFGTIQFWEVDVKLCLCFSNLTLIILNVILSIYLSIYIYLKVKT